MLNIRDEAIIALLCYMEAGISETGTLTVRHLSFDEYSAVVNVKGKTGLEG
jgi:hypothetical protein